MPTVAYSQENQFLIASLALDKHIGAGRQIMDWNALWVSARDHCIAPYLHKRWVDLGILDKLPQAIAHRFSTARAKNSIRNHRLALTLDELRVALESEGIPILISKGLPVSQEYYADLGLRVLYDLDLFVLPRHRSQAAALLRRNGYKSYFAERREQEEGELFWRPQPYKWDPDLVFEPDQPCFVELHTKPWEPRWHGFRVECRLNLWDGSRVLEVSGMPVRVPSVEKLLVHLAVHYAFNVLESSARLMHLLDIALLLHRCGAGLDWDVIWDEIVRNRVAPFCFVALELARMMGGTGIPDVFRENLRNVTPRGIAEWLESRAIGNIAGVNVHHRDQSLIYFLHWNMAETWSDKAGILLHSLRAPWFEATGAARWQSLFLRMTQRLHYLARACHM